MEFTTGGDDNRWKRKFAFFPTRVGKDANGRTVWFWLRYYKQRNFNAPLSWDRRPAKKVEGVRPIHLIYIG